MLTSLPPSSAVVMKFGNLNFLEPSGPFQVCNGTASNSDCGLEGHGSNPNRVKIIFHTPKRPGQFWDSPILVFSE
jgi:hypothetical protein